MQFGLNKKMKIRRLHDVFNPNNKTWGNWHFNQKDNHIELFDDQEKYSCIVDLNSLKNARDVLGIIFYMKPKLESKKDFKDMITALEDNVGIYSNTLN